VVGMAHRKTLILQEFPEHGVDFRLVINNQKVCLGAERHTWRIGGTGLRVKEKDAKTRCFIRLLFSKKSLYSKHLSREGETFLTRFSEQGTSGPELKHGGARCPPLTTED